MSPEASTMGGDQSVEELRCELAEARRELAEAQEQQTATAGILAALSSSPADLQRVCAEIAANAARLCDAYDASIFQVDAGLLHLVGHHGPIPQNTSLQVIRGFITGRVVLE